MPLTFKSTRPERVTFIEENPDGRDRIVTATRDDAGSVPRWTLELTHPSGFSKVASYTGNRIGVGLAIDSLLDETRAQFAEEGRRGDRRPAQLDPLRGSVAMPSAPIIFMGKNSR